MTRDQSKEHGGCSSRGAGRCQPPRCRRPGRTTATRRARELAGLYSEHTDVRHPFAPLGDRPLRTRAELRQHFAEGPARTRGVERFEPVGTLVHETADPELVVVEFRYEGSAHGRSFSLPCIFVVRVRDGMVIESRDYSDHVAFARAFGQPGELAHALAGQAN